MPGLEDFYQASRPSGPFGGLRGALQQIADPENKRLSQWLALKELELHQRQLEDKPQIHKIQDPNTGYETLVETTVGQKGQPPTVRNITADLFKSQPAPAGAPGQAP